MRKGLILAGSAGAYTASRMIAGTIVVSGALGDHPGYGMRRGTLIAGGHGALLPTFVETGTPDLVFVRLLAQSLKRLGAAQAGLLGGTLRRYSGDLATLGKGELFVPA
jgi:formylmethanofuran dehydrogenase subunit C